MKKYRNWSRNMDISLKATTTTCHFIKGKMTSCEQNNLDLFHKHHKLLDKAKQATWISPFVYFAAKTMITLLFLPSIFSFFWSLIFSLCNLHDLHNLFSKIVICTYKVLALNMAYFSWLNMTRYFGLPLIPGFLTDIWHLESTDSTGNTKKRTWASHHMKSTWTSIQILEKGHSTNTWKNT